MSAPPTLRTLMEQIRALSKEPITQIVVAEALGIKPESLSRLLNKEDAGKEVPKAYLQKLRRKFSHLLNSVDVIVDERVILGKMQEELIRQGEELSFLLSYVKENFLTDEQWKEAEASIRKGEAEKLAKLKGAGISS